MRRVLVLIHCQEANRRRVEEGFIVRLAEAIQERDFDEVIHLSAPIIVGTGVNGAEDSPIFAELRRFIDRAVGWNYSDSEPSFDITERVLDGILGDALSYKEAGREKMEEARWNIPLAAHRDIRLKCAKPFPREFAWVPETFRDPDKWRDAEITLGGLFEHQCVQDVNEILDWMEIRHCIDPELVSRGIE